ncbi:flavin monooxygenase-like protein, partial [Tuber indicum]
WHYTDPDPQTGKAVSSIYRGVMMNSSRKTLMMGDFPMDPYVYAVIIERCSSTLNDMRSFLDCSLYTRLNHLVRGAYPVGGGKWTVEVESGGEVMVDTYGTVFVCTGHHSTPNVPNWQCLDEKLAHRRCYRDPVKFRGKDVAIVGVGNSGADISTELSTCAKSTHLITRSGTWAWPRFVFGEPYEDLRSEPLTLSSILPEHMLIMSMAIARWILGYTLGAISKELKPEHNPLVAHPTVRGDLIERISAGVITPHRGSIKRFTKREVEPTKREMVEPLDTVFAHLS